MTLKVKICGIKTQDALEAAVLGGAYYAGFVLHPPSPRNLSIRTARELRRELPSSVKSVIVCVDPSDALIQEIADVISPDFIQLHGGESPSRVTEIKQRFALPVIRAFGILQAEDLRAISAYEEVADMLLLDARSDNPDVPGGTGHSFDWRLLAGQRISVPWFLSGGLNESNLSTAIHASGARMVDVSSGVEKTRGVKDPIKIRSFLTAAHTLELP